MLNARQDEVTIMVVFCILATLREAWFAQTIVDHLVTIVVPIDLDHGHIQ